MKPTRYKKWAALALALANGFFAVAQSNRVPGPADYAQFSSFITARNIFDPNRYAYNPDRPRPIITRRQQYTPSFTLVGTMSYEKGMFAFFDGNQPNLRKVLYQSDSNSIAGFTVADIARNSVILQTADKKQTVPMKIGQTMRQEGSNWQLADSGQFFAGTSSGENTAPAAADSSSPDTGSASAPSPAIEGNDVLKKLMQQREQELK
jgi:hypothetical protein